MNKENTLCQKTKHSPSKKTLSFNVEKFNSFKNSKGEPGLIQWHKTMETKIKRYETKKKKEKEIRTKYRLQQMDLEIDRLTRELKMLEEEVESGEAIHILEKEKDQLQMSRKEMLRTTFDKSVRIIKSKKRMAALKRANHDLDDELRFFYQLFRKQDLEETQALKLMGEYNELSREIDELVPQNQDQKKPFFITQVSLWLGSVYFISSASINWYDITFL